jgi:hypothetical protein
MVFPSRETLSMSLTPEGDIREAFSRIYGITATEGKAKNTISAFIKNDLSDTAFTSLDNRETRKILRVSMCDLFHL